MDDQIKFQRMLTLLLLLCGGRTYTVEEIKERFDISTRTFYRYIATFKESGLIVEHIDGRYSIRKIDRKIKDISELLHFSEEEAAILKTAIHAVHDDNLLKINLIKKLYSIYDFDRVVDTVVKPELSINVHQLIKSIKEKKQARLINYHSAHSNQIGDRVVEPFDFTTNYQMIWAYDVESEMNKQFKVTRIRTVNLLPIPWCYEKEHRKLPMDDFRISGSHPIPVKLEMSLLAYNLLLEEYPLAEKRLIQLTGINFLYSGEVYGYQGVGRFCMGLPGQVRVIEPEELKQYISRLKKIQL